MSKRPLRQPRQKRAKATVEAMVEAAASVLAERGSQNTTAQHIADRAGVGIGSFYEYFPNKEAIFDVVFRQLIDETLTVIRELTPVILTLPVREGIRALLVTVGQMLRRDEGRFLRCAQQALRAETQLSLEPIEQALRELAMQYLMQHPQYLRMSNSLRISIYIFIHGGMHAFIHHMNERNPAIRYDELVEGLVNMIGHFVEREMQLVELQPAEV